MGATIIANKLWTLVNWREITYKPQPYTKKVQKISQSMGSNHRYKQGRDPSKYVPNTEFYQPPLGQAGVEPAFSLATPERSTN